MSNILSQTVTAPFLVLRRIFSNFSHRFFFIYKAEPATTSIRHKGWRRWSGSGWPHLPRRSWLCANVTVPRCSRTTQIHSQWTRPPVSARFRSARRRQFPAIIFMNLVFVYMYRYMGYCNNKWYTVIIMFCDRVIKYCILVSIFCTNKRCLGLVGSIWIYVAKKVRRR